MNRKNSAQMKVRDFDLSVKADGAGQFTGYGSVFGVMDSYREIVVPGAFGESLAEIKRKGRPVPVLYQHRAGEPIGIFDQLAEDGTGLKVVGQLAVGKVARADEAFALMEMGAISGLSIGYFVPDGGSTYDEKQRIRTLHKLDLVEISLVTFPANDDARVETIKMKLAHGSLPTLREFEELLREHGFSKSQAALIATRGLKDLLNRGDSGSGDAGELSAALAAFKIPKE